MRVQKRLMVTLICALSLLTHASVVTRAAQEIRERKQSVASQETMVFSFGQEPNVTVLTPSRSDTVTFLSAEMSFDGKVVKGAPYSAQAVNETIQVLADGNRIVRRSTSTVYRDSEGRTRREQTLGAVGPFSVAGEQRQMVFINDAASGANYILDPEKKTAKKLLMRVSTASGKKGADTTLSFPRVQGRGPEVFEVPFPPPAVGGGGGVIVAPSRADRVQRKEAKTESLGKQSIEGVEAEGTRSTITIAAGEIGNELPINIVSETWYSPELQMVVMTRHSDPRFGETTYKLTNINRSEPARSLFEVPSDYTIDEPVPGEMKFKIERELQNVREKVKNQSY